MRSQGTVSDEAISAVFETVPSDRIKAQTPSQIAEKAGITEKEAALALSQLRQEQGLVNYIKFDSDDEPAYWKTTDGGVLD
jgi:ABC-type branched-subunit amino acid transport system substrate-binding protein